MRIDFVTIFPRMLDPLLAEGVIARGIKQGLIDVRVWDLRDFTADKHRSTDDEAYGGGPGMVMLAEPVLRAVEQIAAQGGGPTHIVMTSPKGRRFDRSPRRRVCGAIRRQSTRCRRSRTSKVSTVRKVRTVNHHRSPATRTRVRVRPRFMRRALAHCSRAGRLVRPRLDYAACPR